MRNTTLPEKPYFFHLFLAKVLIEGFTYDNKDAAFPSDSDLEKLNAWLEVNDYKLPPTSPNGIQLRMPSYGINAISLINIPGTIDLSQITFESLLNFRLIISENFLESTRKIGFSDGN